MKKRNKKYNPRARAISYAKKYAKQFCISWCGPDKKAEAYRLNGLLHVVLKQSEALALTDVPHKWATYIIAILRDHTGREYIQSQRLSFPQELYSDEISGVVNEHITALIKTCNANHFVNTGWVATPSDRDIPDEYLAKMMDHLGAWEYLAQWEATPESETVEIMSIS